MQSVLVIGTFICTLSTKCPLFACSWTFCTLRAHISLPSLLYDLLPSPGLPAIARDGTIHSRVYRVQYHLSTVWPRKDCGSRDRHDGDFKRAVADGVVILGEDVDLLALLNSLGVYLQKSTKVEAGCSHYSTTSYNHQGRYNSPTRPPRAIPAQRSLAKERPKSPHS